MLASEWDTEARTAIETERERAGEKVENTKWDWLTATAWFDIRYKALNIIGDAPMHNDI